MASDFGALNWVKGELDETIRQARCALEDYVEQSEERSSIQTCIKCIHQVQGILHMVQLYGPAMLAEEMELVAVALKDGKVRQHDDAAEALMLALIQFPDYLEKLQVGEPDIPLIILPLLNDLRATRDAPLLSEAALFSPELEDTKVPGRVDGAINPELPAIARQIRHRYHLGLLNWFQNMDEARGFHLLANALDELAQCAGSKQVHRLFWVAHAVVQGLKEDAIGSGVAVKLLLGKLDREIKRIIDDGEEAIVSSPATGLLKNLLYYVAQSPSENAYLGEVKRAYQLHNVLPSEEEVTAGRQSLNSLNTDLLESVKAAINNELTAVKDTLDLYIRGDRSQIDLLLRLEQPLSKVADTLGMVGQGALRSRLVRQVECINQLKEGNFELDDNVLMEMAGDILFVESTVNSLSEITSVTTNDSSPEAAWGQALPAGEYAALVKKAVHEAKVDIAKAKEAVVSFVAAPQEPTILTDVPHYFQNVCGALKILLLIDASDILEQLSRFIEKELLGNGVPLDKHHLNALAEVISGIEYYLESLVENVGNREEILAIARRSLIEMLSSTSQEESLEEERPEEAPQAVEVPEELREEESQPSSEKPVLEDIDPEILEIFVEEAREVMEGLEIMLPRWKQNPEDHDALITLRRSFHTLKGSGRLVGAEIIGELAWSVEDMLNRALNETIHASPAMFQLLDEVIEILPPLIDSQERSETPPVDTAPYIERAAAFSEHREPVITEQTTEETGDETPHPTEAIEPGDNVGEYLDVDSELSPPLEQDSMGYEYDTELIEIFEAEAQAHLATLDNIITTGELSDEPQKITDEMVRACHTLRGCARTAGIGPMAQMGEALEHYTNAIKTNNLLVDAERLALIKEGVDLDRSLLAAILDEHAPCPDPTPYLDRLHAETDRLESEQSAQTTPHEALDEATLSPTQEEEIDEAFEQLTGVIELDEDGVLIEVFLEETRELTERLCADLQQWREAREEWPHLLGLQRTLHTLKGSARLVGATPVGDLSHAIESLLTTIYQHQTAADDTTIELVQRGIDQLATQTDEIEQSRKITFADQLVSELHASAETVVTSEMGDSESGLASEEQPETPVEPIELKEVEPETLETPKEYSLEEEALQHETENTELPLQESESEQEDEFAIAPVSVESVFADSELLESDEFTELGEDDELIEVFFEEARELTESLENSMQLWHANDDESQPIDQLQRTLHTLKGSARLAGAQPIGDLSHAVESLLSQIDEGKIEADTKVKHLLQQSMDRLAGQVDEAESNRRIGSANKLIERLQQVSQAEAIQLEEEHASEEATEEPIESPSEEEELSASTPTEPPKVTPTPVYQEGEPISRFASIQEEEAAREAAEKTSHSRSQVRVNSDLLDRMVNQAGEVSIYRSRLEQQNSSLKYNLQEFDRTVMRLHEQLRKLEIETETQILFRHEHKFEKAGDNRSDFDPLELDRFSTMQQLSRSLMETVSDLGSIGSLLEEQQRDTDKLLLQQSRISTDLQDSLLHTRMVPFSQLVPRLNRVVRQTATQLGRQAKLKVIGAEGEMDRNILDRMVPALEHLLRNAVSHGIETPEVRKQHGKSKSGEITLSLSREGTNIVLLLEDDGAGLNLQAIHDRALQQGLLDADVEISDDDLIQLVLESGFSTAKEVTQIAGRGVGLDVVSSEVKQLGGVLNLSSEPGKGTRFHIQLPLTLAITDTLLIQMGEHIYAVLHGSIEGVVRISRDELLAFYDDRDSRYSYAGNEYRVDYLGHLLATGSPHLLEGVRWFPLLLVHVGKHRIALQVDALLGTRQVVVKAVGSQIASLRWVAGGTILGDGRVALIMDMNALVRAASTHAPVMQVRADKADTAGITAMVVDDSITVRKVTSRLLERHNMQVLTAKDGVDAITLLQDHHPDVMLLDIEMPRMDGFELARHMLNSTDWKDIPIIMISSRVGEKHRKHAFKLGVKSCLGKPYQETDLLENIYAVLNEEQI